MIRLPHRSPLSSSSAASDVYKRQVQGSTPLSLAVDANLDDLVQLFLRHGASYGETLVHRLVREMAASRLNPERYLFLHNAALEILTQPTCNVDLRDSQNTLLELSTEAQALELCTILVERGADLTAVGKNGLLPAEHAVALLDTASSSSDKSKFGLELLKLVAGEGVPVLLPLIRLSEPVDNEVAYRAAKKLIQGGMV
eukprot:TRINITY_DN47026_c0_g1_i1.p1 TRINITY_DN47026_c0_g1~~TRINITY_DN47026_c0_g1_i1.p1  ORF type:complete len:199 (-),score=38.87 TRINITY_DN47026_c0_g1_i1:52-648(-)